MPGRRSTSPQPASPPIPPPLPPPLPPQQRRPRVSPFILKVRNAPTDWFYQPSQPPPFVDRFKAPTGPYFFYGTLMDPDMISDILELEDKPVLRPAEIIGYQCKLWGQYPAVQDGPQDAAVPGAVYHVQSSSHGKRLAEYETDNYMIKPCLIEYTDGKEPASELGNVFIFSGNPRDLTEGHFDLAVWLQRMGRQPRDVGA